MSLSPSQNAPFLDMKDLNTPLSGLWTAIIPEEVSKNSKLMRTSVAIQPTQQ